MSIYDNIITSISARAILLLILTSFSGAYLSLRDHFIANSSRINIRSIGRSSDHPNYALLCITDYPNYPGCRYGEWYFPNGDKIHYNYIYSASFYRRGRDQHNRAISLNRPPNVMTPTGQFCCKVPDATYTVQTLCVIIGKNECIASIYKKITLLDLSGCTVQIVHQSLHLVLPLLVKAILWSIP